MKKEKEVLDETEETAFMQILQNSFYKVSGRTKQDRYVEFNNVFMGSDEGKRVLYEILALAKLSARLVAPFPAPVDKDRMLLREGARQLAADILDVINKSHEHEKKQPKRANIKPDSKE